MKLSESVLRSILSNTFLDHTKDNIMGQCPWCHGNEWGISLKENHPWNCFRKAKCGESGGIFKLLKKLNRLDLLGNNGIQSIKYDERLENIIERKIEETQLDLNLSTITTPIGWKRVYSNFYLENRNFDSFEKYEVGIIKKLDFISLLQYDKEQIKEYERLKDHVIILLKEDEEIKGYIARIAKDRQELKLLESQLGRRVARYRNSKTDLSKLLVGYEEINENTHTVILVEGLFGKENIDRVLQLDTQDAIKCNSTSGAKISEEQIFKLQLKGIKNIILFYDIDVINKIKKISISLLNEFESVLIAHSTYKDEQGNDKDPADLNEIEMGEVFDNLMDPIKFYFNKVQVLKLE